MMRHQFKSIFTYQILLFKFNTLFSTNFTNNMDISYNEYTTENKMICVITSGGVTMAAIINMETIAYFLILISETEDTKPALPIKVNNTGN